MSGQIDIESLFDSFRELRILIIGDVMLDAYYMGVVDRISPEAPVPIISVTKKDRRPGGAANVAFNLHAMGATPIMCSIRGNDKEGEWLSAFFQEANLESNGLIVDHKRPTTVKTRIIGNKQQVLRVDEEDTSEISKTVEQEVLAFIKTQIDSVDAVVFEDYNKGMLTKSLIQKTIKLAQDAGIPTLVDPKKEHFYDYKKVTLFKPNKKEIIEGLKLDSELLEPAEIDEALDSLADKLQADYILLTLSQQGVVVYDKGQKTYLPAYERKILDVSGAGDTVISIAALCVAVGADYVTMANLSNMAGGLVCEKLGVVPIDRETLKREALKHI